MAAGADMCINSTHKMLGSLSQTAMLHVQGIADPARPPQGGLQALSLDVAQPGAGRFARRGAAADGARRSGAALAHDRDRERSAPPAQRDPERALLRRGARRPAGRIRSRSDQGHDHGQGSRLHRLRGRRDPAPALQRAVRARRPVQHAARCSRSARRPMPRTSWSSRVRELSREDRPVDIFSPSGVLERAAQDAARYKLPRDPADCASCRARRSWRDRVVPFKTSAGRICAEVVTPYPPGIPVISPGEEITREIISYLNWRRRPACGCRAPTTASSRRFAWSSNDR